MGLVYIVKNQAFPHLIKIGMTTKNKLEDRGLDNSSVPDDFEKIRVYEFENANYVESMIHAALKEYRYRKDKEFFFTTCQEKAVELLDKLSGKSKGKLIAMDEETPSAIRKNTTFKMLKIPIGTELYLKGKSNCKVITIDDTNQVKLKGEPMAITRAAKILLYGDDESNWKTCNGFYEFSFNGKRLWYMRPDAL